MSWEVEWSEEGYKSVLILSEMVYVKQMHEDCFSLVSESFSIKRKLAMEEEEVGRQADEAKQERRETAVSSLLCLAGLFTASARGRNDHLLGKT